MGKVIIIMVIGYAVGFYLQWRRAMTDLAKASQKIAERDTELSSLRRRNDMLETQAAAQKKDAERRRQYSQDNDVTNPKNQLRFISECSSLKAGCPVNSEAAKCVLYVIEEWIRNMNPGWRLAFEVSMAAFIKTPDDQDDPRYDRAFNSYRGKRVDFLLINRKGYPMLVVEYNGSGHNKSGNADAYMAVKRLALQKAGIPLLEIPEKMDKSDVFAALSEKLGMI